MNNYTETDSRLTRHLLSILEASGEEDLSGSLSSSQDASQIHAARELKKFMDEMPGGFFIYLANEEEEIIYANPALLRILGCNTLEEFYALTNSSFRGLVHPDDLEEVEVSIREQIAHSRYDLDYVEYRVTDANGKERWVEDYGHFIQNEAAGSFFYVFIGDATEKRQRQMAERDALLHEKQQKEQMLRRQIDEYDRELKVIHQEHLQRLEVIEGLSINYDSILYVLLDADRILPYRLSERTDRQFEWKYQPLPFRTFTADYVRTWVHPDDQTTVAHALDPSYIRRHLLSHKTYYINYRAVKNGELQYLQLRIADVGNGSRISKVVIGCRRVDEEVRHEMEQKKLFEDALNHTQLANIARNTFLSNMSHDMRTPLNAIMGFTALAGNHADDPRRLHEYLDKINDAGSLLLRLVDEILEITRMESGTIQIRETECSLTEIIQDVYSSLLPQASEKHISLSSDLSDVRYTDVHCDGSRLKQLLLYFGSNAVKFTPEGGRIRIHVSEQKEEASNHAVYRFSVEDNGIGIAEEELEHIFEPFERLKNTTQSGIPGAGLGLTLARQLADIMGGRIEVHSVPDSGSTFTAIFDLRIQKSALSGPARSETALAGLLDGRKVLLVDDNELNLEIEAELLSDAGIIVEPVNSGRNVIRRLQDAPPGSYALILMDIQMPDMNGHETARAVRSLKDPGLAGIPIIAVSANAFEEDRRKSRESGMNAHIAKPIDMKELLGLMRTVLIPD